MNDPFGEENLVVILMMLFLAGIAVFAWTQFVLSVIIKGAL